MNEIEERCYEIAAMELANKEVRPGIYAKAYAEAGGDDAKAKAYYIKYRVKQLINEINEDIDKQKREERLKKARERSNAESSSVTDIKEDENLEPEISNLSLFKDIESLTDWTKILLYVQIAIVFVSIFSNVSEYLFLKNVQEGAYASLGAMASAGEAVDARQTVVGIAHLVIFLIAGTFVLAWIYRANNNARQRGAAGMVFTPGWSIGWYFVPFANLWKPYQAMKEIWKASASPGNWKDYPVPNLLRCWWFLWVLSWVFWNLLFKDSFILSNGDDIDDFISLNILGQISNSMEILGIIMLVSIINQIYEMQTSWRTYK